MSANSASTNIEKLQVSNILPEFGLKQNAQFANEIITTLVIADKREVRIWDPAEREVNSYQADDIICAIKQHWNVIAFTKNAIYEWDLYTDKRKTLASNITENNIHVYKPDMVFMLIDKDYLSDKQYIVDLANNDYFIFRARELINTHIEISPCGKFVLIQKLVYHDNKLFMKVNDEQYMSLIWEVARK